MDLLVTDLPSPMRLYVMYMGYSWRRPLSLLEGALCLQLFATVLKLFPAFGSIGEPVIKTIIWARVATLKISSDRKKSVVANSVRNHFWLEIQSCSVPKRPGTALAGKRMVLKLV